MKENKSIDGLTPRSARNTAAKSSANKKSSSSHAKSPTKSSTSTPIKVIETTTNDHLTDSPIAESNLNSTPEDVATTKNTREQSVEDFLKPVQAFDFNTDTKELTATKPDNKTTHTKDNAMKNPSHTDDTAQPKKSKKPSKARKIITIILLVIVLAAIGLVLWGVFWGNDIIAKITGGQGNVLDLLTFVDEKYEPLRTDVNGRTNILAFGTSGYNMEGDEGNGVHDGAQLTDSIMMISLNQDTGDIAMLSLPRDLKASPTCTATGKINEVYWCNNMYDNNEQAGAEALMTEVGSILGVDFQYYAHLNWGSLVSIVDLLGGINVTLDEDIADYGWTEAVFEAGKEYTINGEQALGLARARHGTMGGDFTRGASQQKILIGIKNKVFEKDLSITDLISLASTLGDNLRTNFSLPDLKTLAHLTYLFDFDSMRQIALVNYNEGIYYMTTGMINGISYVLPAAGVGNYGAIQAYVAEQLSNDPRDYESPTILVLNASDVAGVAATERNALNEDGFKNIDVDNAPDGEYPAGTTIYAIANKPGTKRLLENHYGRTILPATDLPSSITTRDYDFIIILNPETDETAKTNEPNNQ
ncbi:LCP family protein [Candidatus Saccharibacteria bacterium]|nr:LCP family protein [Candidatus Saccharibacteria bacterium]